MADRAKSARKFRLGERVELEVSGIAHGGESIARLDGWVFFLRYAIPGERVIAEITEVGKSFHRADALDIILPSPDRIPPACPYFHPRGCGGCDFHHISLDRQRQLKSQVISEQFKRLAKMEIAVPVRAVENHDDYGLHYRTRVTLHTNKEGRAGFRKSRSHEVLAIDDCVVVAREVGIAQVLARRYPADIDLALPDDVRIEEITVRGKKYSFRVSSESFWQGHFMAAEIIGTAALEALAPKTGERALDLYGGVGLFGKLLADHGAKVDIIEASAAAVRDGIVNLQQYENARYHHGDVAEQIHNIESADLVLLDPPRSGADIEVLKKIVALHPRTICYISCDPASLARDCARLAEMGYRITATSAYDLFPQTAHIECVFTLEPVIS